MAELSVLHGDGDQFTVLLNRNSGRWKIVEGRHDLDRILSLAVGMDVRHEPRNYHVITIFLNNNCNLRCDYCRFEELTHYGIEHGARDLDAVVASVTDLVDVGSRVEIHFQGGEPLLRHQDIRAICERLTDDDRSFECRFHVTTNGTIASDKALAVIEDYDIEVTISLDGLPHEHDSHRVFANGAGSFDKVVQTIEILRKRNIPFGIFCVVSDPSRMEEIQNYFVAELGIRSFLLAPLEIDGSGSADELDLYLDQFFSAQMRILEQNIDRYMMGGPKISEHLGLTLLRGKAMPSYFSKACGDTPHSSCGERMHSIERDGSVRPCQNTRMIANEDPAYLEGCLTRHGICESCDIRSHCSTPICFSRLPPNFVRSFARREEGATRYISNACSHLKRREVALFDLLFRRRDDVLSYLAS